MVQSVTGDVAASNMAGLIGGSDSAYYDGDMIIDAQGLLGDAAGKLSAIAMHSAVRNDLLKKDKTAFETYRGINGIEYSKYLGYDVIVDDTCPASGGVYTSYLFTPGALSVGTGTPAALTLTETDRDSLASNDILVNRRAFVIHPNGMKWKGSPAGATATNAELATGTNWERVSDIKNMGIVMLKGKIGSVSS